MVNIKYYKPGTRMTLIDQPDSLTGSLVISHSDFLINLQKKLMMVLAILLLFISVFSLTSTTLPIFDGILSLNSKRDIKNPPVKDPNIYSNNYILANELDNQNQEFKITIPKINIVSDVIPNVDSTNEAVYKEQLMKGIAHANGSYLPGQNGPVFMFSHSTDTLFNVEQFNAKFFALKDLETGDDISISYHGTVFKYIVKDKKMINPDELETIRNSKSDLILSTCFPPGTDWMRLIIFADLETKAI